MGGVMIICLHPNWISLIFYFSFQCLFRFDSMPGPLGWIRWAHSAWRRWADAAPVYLPLPGGTVWCHDQIGLMWWSLHHLSNRYASYNPKCSIQVSAYCRGVRFFIPNATYNQNKQSWYVHQMLVSCLRKEFLARSCKVEICDKV